MSLNRRNFLLALAGGIPLSALSGCTGFFKTNFIRDQAQKIRETQQKLFAKYEEEDLVVNESYPEREEEPYWIFNGDGTHTLNYKVAYGDITNIEKILKDQIKGATINTEPALNQFVITTKDESQRSQLEELLYQLDRVPRHVLLRIEINGELGDLTQDYSSELDMLLKSQGEETAAVSAKAYDPGAEPRVMARASMGNRWGLQLESKDFKLQAMLDVLESHGYVVRLYQTDMTIANNKKAKLGEEEKLLIPAYVLSGLQTVVTVDLADVISSVEVTPIIHDGVVETTFQAMIGGSKRPESRQRIMVPIKDTAEINGVYLKVGQSYSVAGILKNIKIGMVRKDPFLPWPSGQDYQYQVIRIWYTVTPHQVIIYDPETLARPKFPIRNLNSDVAASAVALDPNSVPAYNTQKP